MGSIIKPVLGGLGTILGGTSQPTPPPAPPPPAVMPTPDDAAIQAAKKKQLAADMARSGRQSTIMSDTTNEDKLGG